MVRALAILALVAACAPYPDRLTVQGWTLAPWSLPAPEGTDCVLGLIRERAPCPIHETEWGGIIAFDPPGTLGETADLPTWWPGDVPRLSVELRSDKVKESALAHGALHVAQLLCGVSTEHSAWFYGVVAEVNEAVRQ